MTKQQIDKELKKIEKQKAELKAKEGELKHEKKIHLFNEWKKRGNSEKLWEIYENTEIKNPIDTWKSANVFFDDNDYIVVTTEHKVSSLFKNLEEYLAVSEIGYESDKACFMDLYVKSFDGNICFKYSWIDYDNPLEVIISDNNYFTYEDFKSYVNRVDKNTGGNYKVYITGYGSGSNWIRLGDKNDVKDELERLKEEA